MEKFLGHVVATIIDNERSKRRQQDQQQRQHTLPVLDDVAIEASRKASAPAASNDREHSSSAGHWLEREEYYALPARVRDFTKNGRARRQKLKRQRKALAKREREHEDGVERKQENRPGTYEPR